MIMIRIVRNNELRFDLKTRIYVNGKRSEVSDINVFFFATKKPFNLMIFISYIDYVVKYPRLSAVS